LHGLTLINSYFHHGGTERILIKMVQIAAKAKSAEDFRLLVKLLELLGLRRGFSGESDKALSAEFFPSQAKLDLLYRKEEWADIDLSLTVSDPDTAFELLTKNGFDIVHDHSGSEPTHNSRHFVIRLPGKTKVSISGLRVLENTIDTDHLALEGDLSATGRSFALVVSRFNSFITERLLAGAIDGLLRCGADRQKWFEVVRVPGAFEIPSAARTLAETKKYHAIICLGCLLRGDTAHYDVIVNEVTRGIGQSAQETGVPHAFGVLTCETLEQAIDRAGLKMGNKGFEAALAAVEMANLKQMVVGRSSLAVGKKAVSSQLSAVSKKRKSKLPARSKKRSR
jgi:6,7-dimethyl-8-ribityllumazine synthase